MGGFASRGFEAPLLATTARMFAYLCYHLQIPVRHARVGVWPVITSHNDLGAAGGGHLVRWTTCLHGEIREHRRQRAPRRPLPGRVGSAQAAEALSTFARCVNVLAGDLNGVQRA